MARGSILRRRNQNGTTTYSIKYRTADGTQVKRAVGLTRREAEVALTEALAAVDQGQLRSTNKETFAQAADRWLARKSSRLETSTYQDYERHLRLRLIPIFGTLPVRKVTRRLVEGEAAFAELFAAMVDLHGAVPADPAEFAAVLEEVLTGAGEGDVVEDGTRDSTGDSTGDSTDESEGGSAATH